MKIKKQGKVTVEMKNGKPHAEVSGFEADFNHSDKTIVHLQRFAIRQAIGMLKNIESDL